MSDSPAPRKTPAELTATGMRALLRELGPTDAARFLQQFANGQGDYTADRETLLAGWTVDGIAEAIRGRRVPDADA